MSTKERCRTWPCPANRKSIWVMKADHLLFVFNEKTILDTSYYTTEALKSLEQKADEFSQKGPISALSGTETRRTP